MAGRSLRGTGWSRRLQAKSRQGVFLRVQLEELERSMHSDSCQNSLRYTVSHISQTHITHSHRPPPHAQESSGIHLSQPVMKQANVFLKAHMYTHTHTHAHANTKMHTHHPKRIIYFIHTIKDQQQSYSTHERVVRGMAIADRIRANREGREKMCLGRTEIFLWDKRDFCYI